MNGSLGNSFELFVTLNDTRRRFNVMGFDSTHHYFTSSVCWWISYRLLYFGGFYVHMTQSKNNCHAFSASEISSRLRRRLQYSMERLYNIYNNSIRPTITTICMRPNDYDITTMNAWTVSQLSLIRFHRDHTNVGESAWLANHRTWQWIETYWVLLSKSSQQSFQQSEHRSNFSLLMTHGATHRGGSRPVHCVLWGSKGLHHSEESTACFVVASGGSLYGG